MSTWLQTFSGLAFDYDDPKPGQIDIPVHEVCDLADCARAHQSVEAGKRSGAAILRM